MNAFTSCLILGAFLLLSALPVSAQGRLFARPAQAGVVRSTIVEEASGLVASRTYPGTFWTHNDSGGKPTLYRLSAEAQIIDSLALAVQDVDGGVTNRDWEDLAYATHPEGWGAILIAEIGDNRAQWPSVGVYVVPEVAERPRSGSAHPPVTFVELIYEDGARDAETLLVDPMTGAWLVITKREDRNRIYVADNPWAGRDTLRFVAELDISWSTAGDVSPDGRAVVIKNYFRAFYWDLDENTPLTETLQSPPRRIRYRREPQGEAIAFALDGNSYWTLSERRGERPQVFYRYTRR